MSIPAQMRFIDLPKAGGVDCLTLTQGPTPQAAAGELLIAVRAAGVNRPDIVQRLGLYPAPQGHSPILGLEVAGTVAAIGAGVSGWAVGDEVCALTNGGGYAEWVNVPAGQCLPKPKSLSFVQAAAVPETFFTVWGNVFNRAALRAGETLLIHGGSSGIGTTAIQLAKARGASVFVTAGSAAKCEACLALGADLAINYREQDFVAEVMAATDGRGVDVILDMVGGVYVAKNIALAAMEGRIVNIAFLQGPQVTINLMPVMLKRLVITGSTLRPRPVAFKAGLASTLEEKVWPLIASGKIRPVIYRRFRLQDACDAHTVMESSSHVGKLMLEVRPE